MNGFSSLFKEVAAAFGVVSGTETSAILLFFQAGIFVVSGAAKLRRPTATALAMVRFRIARHPRQRLGYAAGGFEIAVAILLLLVPQIGVFVAGGLLIFFVMIIARSLRRGSSFACMCFGDQTESLSGHTLVRAIALLLLAVCLATWHLDLWSLPIDSLAVQFSGALGLLGWIFLVPATATLLRSNKRQVRHLMEMSA